MRSLVGTGAASKKLALDFEANRAWETGKSVQGGRHNGRFLRIPRRLPPTIKVMFFCVAELIGSQPHTRIYTDGPGFSGSSPN